MTLTLTKIKIKDSRDWENSAAHSYEQNEWAKAHSPPIIDNFEDSNEDDTIIINARVTVTFHMIKYFKNLYSIWGIDDM